MAKINRDLMKPESDTFLALKDIVTIFKLNIKKRCTRLFTNEKIQPQYPVTLKYGQIYRIYRK